MRAAHLLRYGWRLCPYGQVLLIGVYFRIVVMVVFIDFKFVDDLVYVANISFFLKIQIKIQDILLQGQKT